MTAARGAASRDGRVRGRCGVVALWLGLAACLPARSPQRREEAPVAIAEIAAMSPGPAVSACGPSPGPALAADRAVTAAVALEDGTVLLAGHAGASPPRPWSALLEPRSGAVADIAVLPDRFIARLARTSGGAVIALAARERGGPVTESARFDVATRAWQPLPALAGCVSDDAPSLRDQYGATVEMAGLSDGGAFVVGHRCAVRLTASGEWVPAPSPPPARGFTLTRLAQGDLLRVGGLRSTADGGDLEATREVHRFDVEAQRWAPVAVAPYYRYNHAAAPLRDGRLLVIGGCEDSGTTCGAEHYPAPPAAIYDPVADRWEVLGAGPVTDRERGTATVLADGRVVVLGGFGGREEWGRTPGALYQDGRWGELPGLGRGGGSHIAVAAGDHHVLIAGGMWKEAARPLLWYGAAAACPATAVELTAPRPPLVESMP